MNFTPLYKFLKICEVYMKFKVTALLLSMSAMAFSTTPHAYVTEMGSDAVSVIDINRNTVQKIFGFMKPHVVRVTFDGTSAYVGDNNSDIHRINCSDHTVTRIGSLSGRPIAFCILPDGSYLYAITHNDTLAIIDLTTEEIIDEIAGLSGAQDIRSTPDGKYIYVTNKKNGTISVFQTSDHTLYQTITGLGSPVGITFDIDGNFAYVTDNARDSVYVICVADNQLIDTILGFSEPRYIAVAPKKTVLYVSNGGNDTVSILRVADNFITGTISVPDPGAIAVTSDGQYLCVASGFNEVFKISTLNNTIERVLSKFDQPSNITFSDNNSPPDTVNAWQVVTDPEHPYNQVTWQKPAGHPFQYRIYRDKDYQELVTTLFSCESLLYNDMNRKVGQTYSYYVIADYFNGFSSTIGNITVSPNRVGLPR
jgi:YVTN family beta-propeller protein